MKRFALAVLGICAIIGCSEPGPGQVGFEVPDKNLESLAEKGKLVSPTSFKGKVVVLDFWATWCGPCKQFMPALDQIYQDYHAKGLEVMSISNEDRQLVEKFHKSVKYSFPVYLDTFGQLNDEFRITSIPRLVVIGRDGRVCFDTVGGDEPGLRSAIEKALDAPNPL